MQVLIVADAAFLARERPLVLRLAVGVMDEGARVHLLVPETEAEAVAARVFAPVHSMVRRGTLIPRTVRLRAQLETLRPQISGTVDAVHAFGEGEWPFAAGLAHELGAPLVVDVWRSGFEGSLPTTLGEGGSVRTRPVLALIPDEGVVSPGNGHERQTIRRLVRWGGRPAEKPPRACRAGLRSCCVLGRGTAAPAVRAALEGWASADTDGASMLFVEADAETRPALWRRAGELGVQHRVSLIDGLERERDVLGRVDLVISPGARGEHRSALLDAMASARPVIATADPRNGSLQEGRTARLVAEDDPAQWGAAVRWVIDHPGESTALGESARAYAKEHHGVSAHVVGVLDTYEWAGAAPVGSIGTA